MSWLDDLRKVTMPDGRVLVGASFRGVTFFVEESSRTGGRRTVNHEFPLRADNFVEDLDRRSRKFSLTGYVIGDRYVAQKNALASALEDVAGPGELVHPYHGVRSAICDTFTVNEKRQDGAFATFSIDFLEAPAQAVSPTIVADQAGTIATSANAAFTATKSQLMADFDIAGLPAFALASAETALTNAADALQDGLAPVITDTQEAAAFAGQIHTLTAEASSLVRTPADMLAAFQAAISDLATATTDAPERVIDALIAAYAADLGADVDETTSTREQERANQLAITGALRRVIAIEAARRAPLVTFASIDDATVKRDEVANMLDEQSQTAGDTAYPALVTLRADLMRSVPGSTEYPRVVTITRRTATPSLLLAYQLYGAVDGEADILARNGVSNPAFLVGDLKVLSDG